MRLFFLLLSFILSAPLFADDAVRPVAEYNDGPYIFLESTVHQTVWVAGGELKQKNYPKGELIEFEEPALPSITVSPATKWTSKARTKYKTDQPIVALSDIHGQYNVFRNLLKRHDIVDRNINWSFGEGHLVIVGDVMDRGEHVMECLWLIYKLEKQAEKAGGKVHFLLGNHELMVMNGNIDYIHPKYRYTAALLERPYHDLFAKNTALGKWLSSKNVILQLNDKLFVHGGLSQQAMSLGLSLSDINYLFKEKMYYGMYDEINRDPQLQTLYYGDGPLWYRGYAYPYSINTSQVDQLTKKLKVNNIIVGHTSLSKIKGLYDNRIIMIDSSIKIGSTGQMLKIEGDKLSVAEYDGRLTPLISEEKKEDERQSLFEYLYNSDKVVVNLSESYKTVKQNFEKDESETPGVISITADKDQFVFNAKFELGGKSRRKICSYPPIKINFKKQELEDFNFHRANDRIKLVMQCKGTKSMVNAIKMEKLIYDLYEVVSPYGHRAKMSIVNVEGEKSYQEALILESDDDLCMRTDTRRLKVSTISTDVVDRPLYIKMVLFQYLIANTDWSARKGHNTDLFMRNSDSTMIVIPYDFDYAGIINTDYAIPSEKLPIASVTERHFMDKNITEEELNAAIDFYIEKETDFFAVVENASFMDEKTKKRANSFIQSFYKIIKDEKKVKRQIRQ
ncbi:MAG: metallophosphoesterase [Bacteroidia bacterium]|nr:metallophosphoesterase [Bacteroidia bacterium]